MYYIQIPETNTTQPVRNKFHVSFRNWETDTNMKIHELDESDEMSIISCGKHSENKRLKLIIEVSIRVLIIHKNNKNIG